jgi:hypothetical protein
MTTDFLTSLVSQASTAAVQSASNWHRLPGGRLELGATGYAIRFCATPDCYPYHLADPDGRAIASHGLLQPLKEHAEACAADRREILGGC